MLTVAIVVSADVNEKFLIVKFKFCVFCGSKLTTLIPKLYCSPTLTYSSFAFILTFELISPPTLCFGNKLLLHTHSQLYELNMSDLKVHEIAKGFASGITDIQLYHHKLYASSQTDGILVLDTNYSLLQKINIEHNNGKRLI